MPTTKKDKSDREKLNWPIEGIEDLVEPGLVKTGDGSLRKLLGHKSPQTFAKISENKKNNVSRKILRNSSQQEGNQSLAKQPKNSKWH